MNLADEIQDRVIQILREQAIVKHVSHIFRSDRTGSVVLCDNYHVVKIIRLGLSSDCKLKERARFDIELKYREMVMPDPTHISVFGTVEDVTYSVLPFVPGNVISGLNDGQQKAHISEISTKIVEQLRIVRSIENTSTYHAVKETVEATEIANLVSRFFELVSYCREIKGFEEVCNLAETFITSKMGEILFGSNIKIVHGDMHFGNILIHNGNPYLIDFGKSGLSFGKKDLYDLEIACLYPHEFGYDGTYYILHEGIRAASSDWVSGEDFIDRLFYLMFVYWNDYWYQNNVKRTSHGVSKETLASVTRRLLTGEFNKSDRLYLMT
ncbi:phosphotransferase [Roseibium marinum]|uniref:Aminoglycoside phosphotransferase domain-containing protein n=1 Tax=Roseibium marinum TaxID=281252 RepID=A0A2S3UJH1_9HYPH|nr:phosphotransferase [Roseibium marinum]POF27805.1 hypothetical protein CLV41_12131 [Roseibium marinum]